MNNTAHTQYVFATIAVQITVTCNWINPSDEHNSIIVQNQYLKNLHCLVDRVPSC